MQKPQPKREVAVKIANKQDYCITLYASKDAIEDFREFGTIKANFPHQNVFWLDVDHCYDFDEVLEYIKTYDKEK